MLPSTVNVVGEREREARSPRANAVEALCLACGTLFVLWPVVFGLGILGGLSFAQAIAKGILGSAMFWMLIGSPFWHRDTAESLGFGNPARLLSTVRERRGWSRWQLVLPVMLVFCGLVALSVSNWPHVARFFWLPAEVRYWPQDFIQWIAVFGFSVFVSALVSTCGIRYDNLLPSLRLAAIVCLALFVYSGSAAWIHRGNAAFERFNLGRLPIEVIGYAFWGFIQQIAFNSYFGTRLRKAFGLRRLEFSRTVTFDPKRGWWLGGILAAMTLAPAVWLTIRLVRGEQVPLSMLAVMMVYAFPVGAVWTYFYYLDQRRMLVATLSGSFFGLIHADSYGLVLVTTGLGTIFAYAAMEDRLRNLAAFALVHGFLGSTFHKLFRDGGVLRVDYRVGPWSVREPSPDVLIVPMLCLIGYGTAAFWAAKYLRHVPNIYSNRAVASTAPIRLQKTPPQ